MILRLMLLWLLLGATAAVACGRPQAEPVYADAEDLSVVGPKLERIQRGEGTALATLVSLKNTSAVCLDNVVIEVRYFGADRQLIDSATESFFDIVVPPGKTVAFRLDSVPLHPLSDYSTQEVAVVSASPRYSRQLSRESLSDRVLAWLPFVAYMLLLVGFLLFLLRSKKSPQVRSLAAMVERNTLLEVQNRQLERIANALESHQRSGRAAV